jgi:hypothetical protein
MYGSRVEARRFQSYGSNCIQQRYSPAELIHKRRVRRGVAAQDECE